jgi:hypothetical protein
MTPSQSKSRAKRASTVLDAAARTARRTEREDDRGALRAEARGAATGRTVASAEAGMASASDGVKAPSRDGER